MSDGAPQTLIEMALASKDEADKLPFSFHWELDDGRLLYGLITRDGTAHTAIDPWRSKRSEDNG